jgi:WD40 repeat protein
VFRVNLSQASAEESERIRDLIQRFEDDDYQVREAASAEIVTIGRVSEPFLHAAMRSEDAEVRVRSRKLREQVLSPEPTAKLSGHAGDVEVVRFSPDGKQLATACRDGDIKIWSVPEFQESVTLRAPDSR